MPEKRCLLCFLTPCERAVGAIVYQSQSKPQTNTGNCIQVFAFGLQIARLQERGQVEDHQVGVADAIEGGPFKVGRVVVGRGKVPGEVSPVILSQRQQRNSGRVRMAFVIERTMEATCVRC